MAISMNLDYTSKGFFPTIPSYRAGVLAAQQLIDLIEENEDNVKWKEIPELVSWYGKFYAWFLVWSPRHDVRAIVEVRPELNTIVLVAVLPRNKTELNLLDLWNQYRTRRNSR